MLIKTEAIVIQVIRYSENSLIVHLFTEKQGRLSCLLHNVHKRGAKNKMSFFQLGSLLNLEIEYKNTRSLQHIKDFSASDSLFEIKSQILKSTQLTLVCEILYKILKEEGEFDQLFNFIKTSILYLNEQDRVINNFYVLFLVQLTKHLGVMPVNNYSNVTRYFDISRSCFVEIENKRTLNHRLSSLLFQFIESGFSNEESINLDRLERNELVDAIIMYYRNHFSDFGELKSLAVLRDVFK